jgi:hypothetical protein
MRTKSGRFLRRLTGASEQGVCLGDGRGHGTPGRICRVENLQVDDGRDLDESHEDGTRTDENPPRRPPVVGTTSISRQLSPHAEPPCTGPVPANGRYPPSVRHVARIATVLDGTCDTSTGGAVDGRAVGNARSGTPSGAGMTALIRWPRSPPAARSRTRKFGHRDRPPTGGRNGTSRTPSRRSG